MKKILSSPPFYLLLAVLFLFALFLMEREGEDAKFVNISNSILKSSYEEDSLSCQFSFQDCSQFGLSEEALALPCYDREDYLNSKEPMADTIASLKSLTPERLSEKARNTYDILLSYLEENLKGCEFPYYEEPLSPTGGIHISLPVLLAEFPIEDEKDLKKYLSLLSLIPSYFESLARFEADKAATGMFMAGEDVDLVVSQCNFFASDRGLTVFRECFEEDVNALFPKNSEKQQAYLAEHESLLTDKISPAYRKLGDSVLLLKESGKERKGLCQYEKGQEYYEYHIQQLIGTDASTKEILQKLQTRLLALYEELAVVQGQYLSEDTKQTEKTTGQIQTGDYLPAIHEAMSDSFPRLPGSCPVTIKDIPDALADYTAPAYYFTPCISLCREGDTNAVKNIIYVGKEAKENPEELFTTLAHEGYPGHMYQNVYFLSSQGVSRKNVLRYCMDFPGYSEGWAMYVELLSFAHAGNIYSLPDAGKSQILTTTQTADIPGQNPDKTTSALPEEIIEAPDENYLQLLRLSREIQLCLLCILDINIHNDGATVEDISPYLARIGIKEPDTIENVYSYLVNEPGTYLKYYVGCLELLECKELFRRRCEETGETYSDLAFHTFFLSHGPDSYTNIKKALQ